MLSSPIFFRSGCSNISDFRACVRAGVPAGVSVARTSRPAQIKVAEYLDAGGKVFADSGAFSAFRRGERMDLAGFHRHIQVCTGWARVAKPGTLQVVAPDVINDQAATVQLLRDFAPRLKAISALGSVVIIPLQKGALSLSVFYALASSLMAPFEISAGLPSNAAAVGSDEVLDFVRSALPGRCHFLGAARNKRFRSLMDDVQVVSPATHWSFDAVVHRSILADLVRTPIKVQAQAIDALESAEIDGTELSPLLNPDDSIALEAFARILGPEKTIEDARRAIETGDEEAEAWLEICWSDYEVQYAKLSLERDFRTRAMAAHPVFADDPQASGQMLMLA